MPEAPTWDSHDLPAPSHNSSPRAPLWSLQEAPSAIRQASLGDSHAFSLEGDGEAGERVPVLSSEAGRVPLRSRLAADAAEATAAGITPGKPSMLQLWGRRSSARSLLCGAAYCCHRTECLQADADFPQHIARGVPGLQRLLLGGRGVPRSMQMKL